MGQKYFISYSRSVKEDVSRLVDLLRAKGHEVWWDADISPAQPWWATIVDKIIWCEIFVFVVSEKSVISPYCLAELKYGTERNRPILPLIIDDQTRYTIPPEVTPRLNQWMTHSCDFDSTSQQIILAAARLDRKRYQDIEAPRPSEPGKAHDSLIEQYQQAVTLAENGHFEEALKNFREIEALDSQTWGADCRQWLSKINLYRQIVELSSHKATLKQARSNWTTYKERYTEEDSDLFNPLDVDKKLISTELRKEPEPLKSTAIASEDIKTAVAAPEAHDLSAPETPAAVPEVPASEPPVLEALSPRDRLKSVNKRYVLNIAIPMIIMGGFFGRPALQQVQIYGSTPNYTTAVFVILLATGINIAVDVSLRAVTNQPRASRKELMTILIGSSIFIALAVQVVLPAFVIQTFNLWTVAPSIDFWISSVITGLGSAAVLLFYVIYSATSFPSRVTRLFLLVPAIGILTSALIYRWPQFLDSVARAASTWFLTMGVVLITTLIFTVPLNGRYLVKFPPAEVLPASSEAAS